MASSAFKRARDISSTVMKPGGAEYLRTKVPAALGRRVTRNRKRVRDRFVSTYGEPTVTGLIARHFPKPSVWFDPSQATGLATCAAHYVAGRFDLLGSGWVDARMDAPSAGFLGHRYPPEKRTPFKLNRANRERADAYASLLPEGYVRLDWQRDLRCGYRWPDSTHSSEIAIGTVAGADIKVPWELGKLQHFPRLALAYAASAMGAPGYLSKEVYQDAFRNQLIDFVASNPPGFGVQWLTAMMASIRGANIMIAYDLFRAAGADFDSAFHGMVRDSAVMHAEAVVDNLEWWDFNVRNNHYLCNVSGLMIVSAYLPCSPVISAWRRLASGELVREFEYQFAEDGSNFEGASAYHGFAVDTLTWGLLFAGRTPSCFDRPDDETLSALPDAIQQRCKTNPKKQGYHALAEVPDLHARWEAACHFLGDLTGPDGNLVQIGDNDSGRFISLVPTMRPGASRESLLCYRSVASAARALVGSSCESGVMPAAVHSLTDGRGSRIAADITVHEPPDACSDLDRWLETAARNSGRLSMMSIALPAGREGHHWESRHYPDFGVFIFKRRDVLLTVRCGPDQNVSDGGHEHDDQGSITLTVESDAVVRDPGTFVYTADAAWRNRFRSRYAHFAPTRARASSDVPTRSAFERIERAAASAEVWSPNGLALAVPDAEGVLYRIIRIGSTSLELVDFAESGSPPENLSKRLSIIEGQPWSDGYGRLVRP